MRRMNKVVRRITKIGIRRRVKIAKIRIRERFIVIEIIIKRIK